MIFISGIIFVGLLGLAFGSFLNVCLSRWPEGESVVQPRSHCRHCSHTLSWWENVPLLSWLVLRGRCRCCRTWIGWRYPAVEFLVAVLWAAAWAKFYPDFIEAPDSAAGNFLLVIGFAFFFWLLVGLAVLDAENLWLPDAITLPGIGLGLAFSVARDRLSLPFGSNVGSSAGPLHALLGGVLAAALAAALILLIRWVYWLVRRHEGIGLGDAKLMALLAAWLGLPQALLAFGLGVLLGALAAVVLLAVPMEKPGSKTWALEKLPLGTFLCIGGVISGLWGEPVLAAYLRWAGF
jgi:leader peptidase (prepilin peptidase)/N-methyltransferase